MAAQTHSAAVTDLDLVVLADQLAQEIMLDAARNDWTEDQAVMVAQMAAMLVRKVHSDPVRAFQSARLADGILNMVTGIAPP